MTKEEALRILDTIPTKGEVVDALEMAIEALEQKVDISTNTPTENDYIRRQAAIDALGEKPLGDTDLDLGCRNQWEWDTEILKTMPSAQPEIIRCRDCIAYQEGIDIDGKPFTRCNGSVRTYGHTLPDWYCADAERRTDERTD